MKIQIIQIIYILYKYKYEKYKNNTIIITTIFKNILNKFVLLDRFTWEDTQDTAYIGCSKLNIFQPYFNSLFSHQE